MSYGQSQALQAAVFQALRADPAVAALAGADVFDAMPLGTLPALFVALGPETVKDASDKTGQGAWHDFTVSAISDAAGFAQAKALAGAISDALVDAPLTLSRGVLVGLRLRKVRAVRVGTGDSRRIDLTFRARVADD